MGVSKNNTPIFGNTHIDSFIDGKISYQNHLNLDSTPSSPETKLLGPKTLRPSDFPDHFHATELMTPTQLWEEQQKCPESFSDLSVSGCKPQKAAIVSS